MNRTLLTIFTVSLAILLASCRGQQENKKVASQGKAYEIVVVSNQENWESTLGDTLREILLEQVPMLNSREPIYDLMRIVPNNFNGLITKHQNILIVNVGPDFSEPRMTAVYDVYAAPQLIATIQGPDREALTDYISDYRYELQQIFAIAERDRTVAQLNRYGHKALEEEVQEKFGFSMKFSRGFRIRSELNNFMWLSYEYPQASQGAIIYTYPYSGKEDFTVDSLMAARNRFVSYVPGENPGSYMTTYPEFIPHVSYMNINGRDWAEMRGFWDVKGDFMGGPFVSYSTHDRANNRIVAIDFYVYSPSPYKHKRNLLRQLENMIFAVRFPVG